MRSHAIDVNYEREIETEDDQMKATVKDVLIRYDVPMLATLECEDGVWAVAMVIDEDLKCLVSRVAKQTIDDLVRDQVEVRDVFTRRRNGPAYISNMEDAGYVIELTILNEEIPDEWLSLPGCFLHVQK